MTNHFVDYRNADVVLLIGSNTAENHPMGMKWVMKAKENGAKLIAVDPRISKSASMCHVHARLRPGTDIAFVSGMINYVIENDLWFKEYVLNYTNASFLINPEYKCDEGIFSGLNEVDGNLSYDTTTWQYQMDGDEIKKDPTLQDPNCVFQILKKHVSRYDISTVCQITGTPEDTYRKVCELFASSGKPDMAGCVIYGMGITMHSVGTQNARSLCILQLLLGNIGIPGGGVNPQRGEQNVQGSTDMAMLHGNLPGYLGMIYANKHKTLAEYIEKETPTGYWSNKPKFLISQLKAWYGDKASKENDFCFDWLPKHDGKNRSFMSLINFMNEGEIKGCFVTGQNPAVGGPSTVQANKALESLEWLVVYDVFEIETAAFWKRPGADPSKINTEVFLLPAAMSYEKEGSVTNSGRWMQWRYKAVNPPEEAKSDLWIAYNLFKAIKKEYQSGGKFTDAIFNMTWDYDIPGEEEPDIQKVAAELNGYEVATRKVLPGFAKLADDGSTACGNWVLSGYWYEDPEAKVPACKRRINRDPSGMGVFPQYSFAWPANRRVAYNRCSADPAGNPWNLKKPYARWDAVAGKWNIPDVPDFKATEPAKEPGAAPVPVPPEVSAKDAYIMSEDGQGRLFAVKGLNDGPLPEHYEPFESPFKNLISKQQSNPMALTFKKGMFKQIAEIGSEKYPIIAITIHVVEHYQSGATTRNCPSLAEISAHMFVNISDSLAQKIGVKTGDDVIVESARGQISCKAAVNGVCVPLTVNGKETEVISMPYSWGFMGLTTGASANDLTPFIGDPNSNIPEYKAFLCNVRKANKS